MRQLVVALLGVGLAVVASLALAHTGYANHGTWVEVINTDALNIHQCADTTCPLADPGRRVGNDAAHPFRQKVLEGEWVKVYGYEMGECLQEDNCLWFQVDEGNYIYSGYTLPVPDPPKLDFACPDGGKCIVVDRAKQRLYALNGSELYLATYTSTGAWGASDWKTPAGTFTIGKKIKRQDMIGTVAATGWNYRLNDVPYQMTYQGNLYKIHGTSTHYRFGTLAVSNGCINLIPKDAERLFNWTPPGTLVIIGDDFSYEERSYLGVGKAPETM